MSDDGYHFHALVTGANSGLGFSIAHRLAHDFLTTRPASHRISIIVTTRSAQKAASTLAALTRALTRTHPGAFSRLTLSSAQVDLTSLASVAALAAHLNASYPHLDALVLNAGMGAFTGIDWLAACRALATDFVAALTFPGYKLQEKGRVTKEGVGEVFAANVFGHYYLAHEVMGLLGRAGSGGAVGTGKRMGAEGKEGSGGRRGGRVVWISSLEAYEWTYDPEDLQAVKASHSYEHSKRLIDVLALTSSRAYARSWFEAETAPSPSQPAPSPSATAQQNVRCLVAHPGICATAIMSLHIVLWWCMALTMYVARWAGSRWHALNCWAGALPVVWLVLASDEELDAKAAGEKKWGAGSDRWGTEMIRETEVEGREEGGRETERWDAVARTSWEGMERLRREWRGRLKG